ncbi:hypothetical protein [Pectobacterium betavasculorum]|uniref:hypothetical protein n=1 Tax=Pectobacterium betavasculorum TaxID=55207 RepID=UPI00068BBF6B|nr:hypothetical protein [Pectobacterium betavasculorum]
MSAEQPDHFSTVPLSVTLEWLRKEIKTGELLWLIGGLLELTVEVPDYLTYLKAPTLQNVISDAEDNSPMAHAARILGREVKFWRSQPLFTAPPLPVVPDELTEENITLLQLKGDIHTASPVDFMNGYNACRAAMLQSGTLINEGTKHSGETTDMVKLSGNSEQVTPTISFYRDGIVAAAQWVEKKREAYDSEHGRHDPDTGTFEFGNDAQLDYSETLRDIEEGIRALHPNAGGNYPAIPEGWAVVPLNASIAMIKAGGAAARKHLEETGGNSPQVIYQAMIAAAPQPNGKS